MLSEQIQYHSITNKYFFSLSDLPKCKCINYRHRGADGFKYNIQTLCLVHHQLFTSFCQNSRTVWSKASVMLHSCCFYCTSWSDAEPCVLKKLTVDGNWWAEVRERLKDACKMTTRAFQFFVSSFLTFFFMDSSKQLLFHQDLLPLHPTSLFIYF